MVVEASVARCAVEIKVADVKKEGNGGGAALMVLHTSTRG